MRSAYRAVAVSAIVAAASLVIRADVTPPSQAMEVQMQLGDILFSEGKFLDSLDAYQQALKVAPPVAPLDVARTANSPAGASAGTASSALNAPALSSFGVALVIVRPRATTVTIASPVAGRIALPVLRRTKPIART